jgi:hypothetical protein
MAEIIQIALKPEEFYLPCGKCSGVLWGIVMEDNTITKLSCAQCGTVYDFLADGLDMDVFE